MKVKYLLLLLSFSIFSSCSYDGRKVKKFISRVNAREINAASKYIYPGDYAKLQLYTEVLEKTPNMFMKLRKKNNIKHDGRKGVRVEIEIINPSPYYLNYLKRMNLLDLSGQVVDTIYIRETNNGRKISFNWAQIEGENLKLATVKTISKDQSVNIYSEMGTGYSVIHKVHNGQNIIINDYSEDPKWIQCFATDSLCNTVEGYIDRSAIMSVEPEFFPLSIFDSLNVALAFIILLVVSAIPLFLMSIVDVFTQKGAVGCLILVAPILGCLYVIYQLLENILFELFIINLPY